MMELCIPQHKLLFRLGLFGKEQNAIQVKIVFCHICA